MAQYIDKDALVTEIERLKCRWKNPFCTTTCDRIEEIIDTIEVKEVQEEPYVIGKTGKFTTTTK